ncbi:hypothetical protein ACFFRR_004897 [Megaselia abdita]
MSDVSNVSLSSLTSFIEREKEESLLPKYEDFLICSICFRLSKSYCTLRSKTVKGILPLPEKLKKINPAITKLLEMFKKVSFDIACNSCVLKLRTLCDNIKLSKKPNITKKAKEQALEEVKQISAYFKKVVAKYERRNTVSQIHDSNRSLASNGSIQVARLAINRTKNHPNSSTSSPSSSLSSFNLESQELQPSQDNRSQEAGPSGYPRQKRQSPHTRRLPSTPERNTFSEEESDEESRRSIPPDSLAHVGPKIKRSNRPQVKDHYTRNITGG